MLEDWEIIARCQRGQRHSMELLIDRYKVALYSLCRKLARNRADADDLFQETWVRVMRNITTFSTRRRFSPWLFAICVNRHRDECRRRRRWRVSASPSGTERDELLNCARAPDRGPDEQMIQGERVAAVKQALQGLDDAYRLPVLLHYYGDLSMQEIGDILSIPSGTVKSRLSVARQKLRSLMEGQING